MPFGLCSSPFLLRVTINKHLKSVESKYLETADLDGTEDIESAKRRVTETNIIFNEAKLKMRSYATNCEELQQYLEDKGLENQIVGQLC